MPRAGGLHRDRGRAIPLRIGEQRKGWFKKGSGAVAETARWFKKGSGTVAGTARRVLRTTVPDPFLNHDPFFEPSALECSLLPSQSAGRSSRPALTALDEFLTTYTLYDPANGIASCINHPIFPFCGCVWASCSGCARKMRDFSRNTTSFESRLPAECPLIVSPRGNPVRAEDLANW